MEPPWRSAASPRVCWDLGRYVRDSLDPRIATSSPLFPSRQVSSWLFGDGAALLNDVAAEFGLTERISPLDAVLASPLTHVPFFFLCGRGG